MSLARAIFGAKPLYGTPPFAGPVPHTGGADPVPAPGAPQHGIAGFLERVFNPQNALGRFSQALVAGGGDPGNAMAYLMQQNAANSQPSRFDEWREQYDYELAHPKPSTAQPYRFEANDGDVYELGADGSPHKLFDDPTPKMNFIPDGMGGGQWVAVPSMAPGSLAPSTAPQGVLGSELPAGWTIQGGGAGNGTGRFRVR